MATASSDVKSPVAVTRAVDQGALGPELQKRLQEVQRAIASSPADFTDLEPQSDLANDASGHTTEVDLGALINHRAVFRHEVLRLRKELDDFRQFCSDQIQQQVAEINEHIKRYQEDAVASRVPSDHIASPVRMKMVRDPGVQDAETWQRLLRIADSEAELTAKEESLSIKHRELVQYEQEILEVEKMLNQRHAVCERRQQALVALDEELEVLRRELEEKRDHLKTTGVIPETPGDRARKNWEVIRRNLLDRQQLLEATVNKYRSELAAATSALAGKDIVIAQLQKQLAELRECLEERNRKIEQLRPKLLLSPAKGNSLPNGTAYSPLVTVPASDYSQGRKSSKDLADSVPRGSPASRMRRTSFCESPRETADVGSRKSCVIQDRELTTPQEWRETLSTAHRRPRTRAMSVDASGVAGIREPSSVSSRRSYRSRRDSSTEGYKSISTSSGGDNQLYLSSVRRDSGEGSATCKVM